MRIELLEMNFIANSNSIGSISEMESKLANLDEDFDANETEEKILALIELFLCKKIIVGRRTKFSVKNIEPLSRFTMLTQIVFNNCNIAEDLNFVGFNKLESVSFNNSSFKPSMYELEIEYPKVKFN